MGYIKIVRSLFRPWFYPDRGAVEGTQLLAQTLFAAPC
jgi:hypothetical protein